MKKLKAFCIVFVLVIIVLTSIACSTNTKKMESVEYPKSRIEGIIAWGAGGVTDSVARAITPIVEKSLGQSIIMVNKTGGSGAIATEYVNSKPADGYTILFHAENPQQYKIFDLSKLDYDDFDIINVLAKNSGIVVVKKDSKFNTLDDLLEEVKNNPGKLNFGADGVGSMPYNCAALLKSVDNVDFNFVTYDGEGSIITAMLGNQVDVTAIGVGSAAQYLKSGDLKALCIMANEPVDEFKDVPALGQIKQEYYEPLKAWGAFFAVVIKKGAPTEVIDKLSTVFSEAHSDGKFQDFLKSMGMTPLGLTGAEARQYVDKWRQETSWVLYDAGAITESPEKFGIKRP